MEGSRSAADARAVRLSALAATYLQAVAISLPNSTLLHLEGSLSMADDQVGWVFSAYIAASAVTMPMTRWLAGAFGRKTVFMSALAVFALGLFLCTQATGALPFVAARVIQGAASGPIAALSLAILLEHSAPDRQARSGLAATVTLLIGILSGPAVGGCIAEHFGWRTMFYAALPAVAAVFAMAALHLSEEKPERNPPFDFIGLVTLTVGMIGLQMFLDRGERVEWFASVESRLEAAAAIAGFYLYGVHILTAKGHFLDKALFRDRNFVLSTVLFFAFGFVLLPTLALTSPMLEELLRYPSDITGYMSVPRGAALVAAFLAATRLPKWVDIRLFVIASIAVVAYGNWKMLGYSPLMDWTPVVVAGAIQGAGLGALMPALNRAAFSTLDPALRAEGMVLFNLARLYGSTIGIAVVQFFFFNNTQTLHSELARNLTVHRAVGRAAELFSGHGLALLNEIVTGQAATIAVIGQFKLLMIVILAASPLALLLRKPRAAA